MIINNKNILSNYYYYFLFLFFILKLLNFSFFFYYHFNFFFSLKKKIVFNLYNLIINYSFSCLNYNLLLIYVLFYKNLFIQFFFSKFKYFYDLNILFHFLFGLINLVKLKLCLVQMRNRIKHKLFFIHNNFIFFLFFFDFIYFFFPTSLYFRKFLFKVLNLKSYNKFLKIKELIQFNSNNAITFLKYIYFKHLMRNKIRFVKKFSNRNLNIFYLSCFLKIYFEQKEILITLKQIYLNYLSFYKELIVFIEYFFRFLQLSSRGFLLLTYFYKLSLIKTKVFWKTEQDSINLRVILNALFKFRFFLMRLIFKGMLHEVLLKKYNYQVLSISFLKPTNQYSYYNRKKMLSNRWVFVFTEFVFNEQDVFIDLMYFFEDCITNKFMDFLVLLFLHGVKDDIFLYFDYVVIFNFSFKPFINTLLKEPISLFLPKCFHYEFFSLLLNFLFETQVPLVKMNSNYIIYSLFFLVKNIFIFYEYNYYISLQRSLLHYFQNEEWKNLFYLLLQERFEYYFDFFYKYHDYSIDIEYYTNFDFMEYELSWLLLK